MLMSGPLTCVRKRHTGIMLADYWLLRRRVLDVDGLFSAASSGPYFYSKGFNVAALAAAALGVAPNLPGFLHVAGLASVHAAWVTIYSYAWFVGFAVAAAAYLALMALAQRAPRR